MKNSFKEITLCRNCKFFSPQSYCAGECRLLETNVQGNWHVCCLCLPAFCDDKIAIGATNVRSIADDRAN
ncbi:hypothetical protein [Chamaesiphon sp. VAR_69_metabat_338]|uniref:hypothetical protein n=1 Tax=Chamaesiphon sp. VAR_69_metabat_338 TaxID=2964704 RepID=UPI00286DE7B2|nr:hypothetical protein [Chamaesiphon sp. VAR_69_metabat_338]